MSLAGAKKWYYANKARAHAASRAWALKNPDRRKQIALKSAMKSYYADHVTNKEAVRLRARTPAARLRKQAYRKARRALCPHFKLVENQRTRVWKALKGLAKSAKTTELIGCSLTQLRSHLELNFQPGMSWENYGAWHVDHKKPCAAFDLKDPVQQRQCFGWQNLQPLWAADNLKKRDKDV